MSRQGSELDTAATAAVNMPLMGDVPQATVSVNAKDIIAAATKVIGTVAPALATTLFGVGSFKSLDNPKAALNVSSNWTLPGLMNASTYTPIFLEMMRLVGKKIGHELPERAQLVGVALSNMAMFAAVCLMGIQALAAVRADDSTIDVLGATAVGCFTIFSMISMAYAVDRALGLIKTDKPNVMLAALAFGFIGSGLFTAKNTDAYLAAREAGKTAQADAMEYFVATAAIFTAATLNDILRIVFGLDKPKAVLGGQAADGVSNYEPARVDASDDGYSSDAEGQAHARVASDVDGLATAVVSVVPAGPLSTNAAATFSRPVSQVREAVPPVDDASQEDQKDQGALPFANANFS